MFTSQQLISLERRSSPGVVYGLTRYVFQLVTRRFCLGVLSSGFVFNELRMVKRKRVQSIVTNKPIRSKDDCGLAATLFPVHLALVTRLVAALSSI